MNALSTKAELVGVDLFAQFTDYLDASPKTIETYSRALRQLSNYFTLNGITTPTRADILSFRDELKTSGHKPTTVQNYIMAARLFFQWTATQGIYPNIADHIKGAKVSKDHKRDYLTSAQVKQVLASFERDSVQGARDYALLALMITGGLRTIEAARANIGDLGTIGDETALYIQGKGRDEKTEYIKVTPQVERALRAYLMLRGATGEALPLFASTSNNNPGERMTTRSISRIVKTRMQLAGFNSDRLTAHSLRHTAVTLSLLAGKDITEAQQFARHANISTTMIYNHALDKSKNSCSEAITRAIL